MMAAIASGIYLLDVDDRVTAEQFISHDPFTQADSVRAGGHHPVAQRISTSKAAWPVKPTSKMEGSEPRLMLYHVTMQVNLPPEMPLTQPKRSKPPKIAHRNFNGRASGYICGVSPVAIRTSASSTCPRTMNYTHCYRTCRSTRT
jgi:hypothetical protein